MGAKPLEPADEGLRGGEQESKLLELDDPTAAALRLIREGHLLPEPVRRRLAMIALPRICDTLTWWLPEDLITVLAGALVLRHVGFSPDRLQRLRDELQAFMALRETPWPVEQEVSREDPSRGDQCQQAFQRVEYSLALYQEIAEALEMAMHKVGYGWDWENLRMKALPGESGGRPRQLLRDIARAYVVRHRISQNTVNTRENIAVWLAPFLDPDQLDTSPGAHLDHALRHALDSKGPM